MTYDLSGLVRHLSRLMLASTVISGLVALVTFLASDPHDRHLDAVIVLATLAVLQAVWWFGLTWWADLADEKA